MRIIIKPMGMILVALAIGGGFAAVMLKKPGQSGLAPSTVAQGKGGVGALPGENLVSEARWKFYTEKGAVGDMTTLRETIGGAERSGLKVTVTRAGEQPWNIGISNPLGVGLKAGWKLKLRFWGRSVEGSQITVMIQRNVPGFPDCFKQTMTLTPEWKEYTFDVTASEMAKWESMIGVHAGFQNGSVEIAGLELVPA